MSKELNKAPVEQAGGDERAAFESRAEDAGSDISLDDFGNYVNVYVQTEWEGWQARAALSKRSKFRQHLDECADEVATWPSYKREALAQPSPAQADEKPGDSILCYGCFAKGVGPDHFDEAGKCLAAQAEQAEAERPDVVGSAWGNIYNNGFDHVAPFPPAPGGPVVDEPLMTVAQHAASVARWAEMFNRVEQERDAALAKVAGLELKLDQSDYAYDNDRCHMRGLAKQAAEAIQVFTGHDSSANLAHRYGEKWWEHLDELRDALLAFAKNAPVAQPEEMPGEILAAKLIETWVTKHGKPAPWSTAVEITAVATNMPNDERDRLLALDDDVDAQAQHSVPGKYDDVLLPFLKSMEHELHANAGKGDRPGWLQMDRRTALLEIYYHLAKLQKATKDNDAAGIVEYAADVANMSMMLVDVCGLLAAAPGKEEV